MSSVEAEAQTPEQALDGLLAGHREFIAAHAKEIPKHAAGQHPPAMYIGCMDSRVPPHLVLNQQLGEMFGQTTAGNVITDVIRGGGAYAVLHGAKAILVLGHTRCGAISATFDWVAHGKDITDPDIKAVALLLKPAVEEAVKHLKGGRIGSEEDAKDFASRVNVENQVKILLRNRALKKAVEEGGLVVAGGIYDLETGNIKVFIRVSEKEKSIEPASGGLRIRFGR